MSFFAELRRRNVLRVAAAYVVAGWLVIQVVETIFPAFGFGDQAIRAVVITLAIGLLPVVVFAWAFELTPEGLKREKDVDRSRSIAPTTGKKLDRVFLVVLALALGYFALDKFLLSPERQAEALAAATEEARQAGRAEALVESYGDKSIAVLPFADMSINQDQEYMSDGIAEELLNLLAAIPELRVISRTSAFSYKGRDINLIDVARELNVGYILEGSVRKAGQQLRITAQLIDARSDTHLWSETFDLTLDDIFAIQDQIAGTVVEQLRITLLGATPTIEETDPEAYALYLQGRHLSRQLTKKSLAESNLLFEQALLIDPEYTAAMDGLASNYNNQASNGLLPPAEGFALSREMTQRALAVDPDNANAHAQLGWLAMYYDNDPATAARHIERALALGPPNRGIIGSAAALLVGLGRLDEAIELGRYMVARDPVNPTSHYNLGIYYLYDRQWQAAANSARTALRLSADYLGAHYVVATALLFDGEPQAALEQYELEVGDDEYRVKGTALSLSALGRQAEYEQALQELIQRWGGEWPSEVAQVYAMAGDPDAAFAWLDKAVAQNEGGLDHQFLLPFFVALYDDPRWVAFLQQVGSSPEQLAAIEFQVTLPE
ncbi:MAG: hypothetical protein WBP60_12880 [Gammaproteobacteria bacterium]